MTGLRLVVLLALSLWPSAVAAGPGARGHGPDVLRGPGVELSHGVFRSGGGLELLRVLDARLSPGGRPDGSSGEGTLPASGFGRRSPRVRVPRGETSAGAADPCAPLCERLPYHATAPPSPR